MKGTPFPPDFYLPNGAIQKIQALHLGGGEGKSLTAKFGTLPDIWMEALHTASSDKILNLYGKAMAAQRLEDVAL